MPTQDTLLNALKSVKYPGYSRDIVSFGIVKNVAVNNGAASVQIELTSANAEAAARIKADCEQALRAVPEVKLVHVEIKMPAEWPRLALGYLVESPPVRRVPAFQALGEKSRCPPSGHAWLWAGPR